MTAPKGATPAPTSPDGGAEPNPNDPDSPKATAPTGAKKITSLRRRAIWHRLLRNLVAALASPAVLTALITTLLGTTAVAIATTRVTKSLGERELQLRVIESLMQFTTNEEINELGVLKLQALVELVRQNDQFDVRVDGFGQMVGQLLDDQLVRKNAEIESLRADTDSLNERLVNDRTLTAAERVSLQRQRDSLGRRLTAVDRDRETLTRERDRARAARTTADSIIDSLTTVAANQTSTIDTLRRSLSVYAPGQIDDYEFRVVGVHSVKDGTNRATNWRMTFSIRGAEQREHSNTWNLDSGTDTRLASQLEVVPFRAERGRAVPIDIRAVEVGNTTVAVGGYRFRPHLAGGADSVPVIIVVQVPNAPENGWFYIHADLVRVST